MIMSSQSLIYDFTIARFRAAVAAYAHLTGNRVTKSPQIRDYDYAAVRLHD
jgi:hypothetical protein